MSITNLEKVAQGLPGISKRFGSFLEEAALVCILSASHRSGDDWEIIGDEQETFQLRWKGEIDEQVLNTWNDRDEATEYGATAMAILSILEMSDYTIVQRSVKGTGFDYWLGKKGEEAKNFEEASARLEISGIRSGDKLSLRKRVYKKLKQVQKSSELGIPALVIVTEFRELITYFAKDDRDQPA